MFRSLVSTKFGYAVGSIKLLETTQKLSALMDYTCLFKKSKCLEDAGVLLAPLDLPSVPVTGWEPVTDNNASDVAKNIPSVTSGVIYTCWSGKWGGDIQGSHMRIHTLGIRLH